ncbi:MAG TPA: response regulator [Gemmataceae bacterium]|jgi:two-component system KDP operon response regulator KdpE|nr:response regulator [Gemmataceae bacterium]
MPTVSPLILLADDEAPIRRFLRVSLLGEGYRLAEADTGRQCLRLAKQQPPDLVILDLGLPDLDGQEVLQQLREWLKVPIIILSARDQEKQKIAALDHGADDYLTKPFGAGELLARIRVALRHAARVPGEDGAATFILGDLHIDLTARRVFVKEEEIHLTPLEYKLLTTMVRHAGKVLTHRFLLQEVWGPHHTHETHYLRVFMAGLRRKIEADPAQPRYLLTEQGVGYRLAAE